MKRILSALLSIAMLLALSVTASAAEFPDVPAGSTYAQAVQWVSQQGYINGYNDGRFGVNDNVTRAQLSAILYRAAGSPAASGTTRFPDVAATAYYAGAASWAADGGLINGYSDGRFGVNDPITRQQVTAIFWRWAGSPAASAEDYADEASISNYAKTAVDWARANSIVPAKDGNRFAPTDNATRGEIALILYNYMNRNSQPVTPSAGNGAKVLVAYFSATGSTQAVANTIASTLNADTFEITPANPYSSADLNWTDSSSRVNDEHDNVSKRNIALVKDSPDNWADYDVVFIGYPIWWGIAAWPVDTFVKANDFTGKTVIPFCTSSSSGLGQSGQLLEEMATGGSWQEGQRFSSGASAGTVTAWVNGLNLPASSAPAVAETAQPSREEGRALVVYFSQPETTNPNNMTTEEDNSTVVINGEVLGNTQYMAQVIQKTANADIFRIEPATPYPTDHTTLVAQAREEQDRDFRPALAKNIDNLSGYDTVFVGSPNWWGDMPMVMYTFFETHDFAGKTIIPFNTHGGSGFSSTISTIRSLEPQAEVLDGLSISRDRIQDAERQIVDWVNGLELK